MLKDHKFGHKGDMAEGIEESMDQGSRIEKSKNKKAIEIQGKEGEIKDELNKVEGDIKLNVGKTDKTTLLEKRGMELEAALHKLEEVRAKIAGVKEIDEKMLDADKKEVLEARPEMKKDLAGVKAVKESAIDKTLKEDVDKILADKGSEDDGDESLDSAEENKKDEKKTIKKKKVAKKKEEEIKNEPVVETTASETQEPVEAVAKEEEMGSTVEMQLDELNLKIIEKEKSLMEAGKMKVGENDNLDSYTKLKKEADTLNKQKEELESDKGYQLRRRAENVKNVKDGFQDHKEKISQMRAKRLFKEASNEQQEQIDREITIEGQKKAVIDKRAGKAQEKKDNKENMIDTLSLHKELMQLQKQVDERIRKEANADRKQAMKDSLKAQKSEIRIREIQKILESAEPEDVDKKIERKQLQIEKAEEEKSLVSDYFKLQTELKELKKQKVKHDMTKPLTEKMGKHYGKAS